LTFGGELWLCFNVAYPYPEGQNLIVRKSIPRGLAVVETGLS